MERVCDKPRAYIGVLFDDIIIHSTTSKEQKEHFKAALGVLCANKLYVNEKGSDFL